MNKTMLPGDDTCTTSIEGQFNCYGSFDSSGRTQNVGGPSRTGDYDGLSSNAAGENLRTTTAATTTATATVLPGENSATILNEIFNLLKNIVGSGGFSLPAAVATFANAPSALLPTYILIFVMGLINAYTFSLLGRICETTQTRSYKDAWDATFGPYQREKKNKKQHQDRAPEAGKDSRDFDTSEEDGNMERWHLLQPDTHKTFQRSSGTTISWGTHIVAMVVVTKTFFGCWGFSIMLASSVQPLLVAAFGWTNVTSPQALIGLTVLIILPLCMSQTFRALAGVSAFGQIGTLFAISVMWMRLMDGSYRAPDGIYYQTLADKYVPSFGSRGWNSIFQSYQSLILISILSTGYMAHYNAPKFYYELQNSTPRRFNIVVIVSFGLSGIIFCFVSSLGFLTFGEHCSGYILDNYSTYDPLAFIARFGIVISLTCSYPLLFIGGREGLMDLLQITTRTPRQTKLWTVILLSIVTTLAIFISDLTFVLSFTGATLSTCLIYIFPSLMYRALFALKHKNNSNNNMTTNKTNHIMLVNATELHWTTVIMIGGIIAGTCGAIISVLDVIHT